MACRVLSAAVFTLALGAGAAFAQAPVPSLRKSERELLTALVGAVDAAQSQPETTAIGWQSHVLRASDGSHYVAFSFTPAAGALPATPVMIYLRLATADVPGAATISERSIVREWLQGSRIDPRLLPRRGIAVGDMPALGAAADISRGGASAVGSPDLQALNLERDRARQRREQEERQRRAELEGTAVSTSARLPFEDFDVVRAAAFTDGTRAIQRAFTAGPGNYDLYVAWADGSLPASKATMHVARRPLRLAPASADFGVSSLIVADGISVRSTPFTSLEQRAHPYSIGPTDIVLARSAAFAPADRLAVAFQIFNPTPTAGGKPSVIVNARIVRVAGLREEPVASLTPLTYDATSMPEDFDLRLGHPVIAALAAPLSTLRRGDYKLIVTAEDRLAGTLASASAPFTIVSTPAGLLAEAPPLAQRLEPAAMLAPSAVLRLLDALAITNPSPPLSRALASARAGRFAELFIEEAVAEDERAARAALTGMALLSVGDLGAIAQFERAAAQGATAAPVQYLLGAALSLQRRDVDAIAAWERAAAGLPRSLTAPLIANMRLLRGDAAGAAASIAPADAPPAEPTAAKILAKTRIATQREREAIGVLDTLLAANTGDLEARWLLVRALYGELVRGGGDRRRFVAEAERYIDAGGPNATLVRDWVAISSF